MAAFSSTSNMPTTIPSRHTPIFHGSSLRIEGKLTQQTAILPPQIKSQQNSKPKAAPLPSTKAKATTTIARATTTIFNTLENVINNYMDPPFRPSVDPRDVLAGNFFSVDELPPTECPVIMGHLPSCLDGAYIRNGPNPQYLPCGPYHHFDGDGMLHSLSISGGRAIFCSRYVKTYKYQVEHNAGTPVFPNIFSGFHGLTAILTRGALCAARVLAGEFNPVNGIGLANTSIAFFGNRLFALGESDLPYAIRLTPNGDIETIGRHDFDGKLFFTMTAHPKIDPDTGETFAFQYGLVPPFLTFFRFNPDGSKQPNVPIFSLTRPSLLHDFAITKKYVIFQNNILNPTKMIFGRGQPSDTVKSDVPRIGVIPRYAKDEAEMRWFEVAGFNMVHAINAWDEEEDVIMLIAPNILSIEHLFDRPDLVHGSVEKVRIDLKTGIVTRFTVSGKNLEMGVINHRYMGRKSRYCYLGMTGRAKDAPKVSTVVKLDLSGSEDKEGTVASRTFGSGCYGGEPFFVPKQREGGNSDVNMEDEDDGYVLTYVHDENTGESRFLVMDAKSRSLEIVAAVKLPQRVPYGYHGNFIRERDLRKLLL